MHVSGKTGWVPGDFLQSVNRIVKDERKDSCLDAEFGDKFSTLNE